MKFKEKADLKKISMASLGCSKNQIDSEQMLSILEEAGYEICENEEDANIISLGFNPDFKSVLYTL